MSWTKVSSDFHDYGTFVRYEDIKENDFLTIEDRKGPTYKYYYGTVIHIDDKGFTIDLEMSDKKQKIVKKDIDEDFVIVIHKVSGGL